MSMRSKGRQKKSFYSQNEDIIVTEDEAGNLLRQIDEPSSLLDYCDHREQQETHVSRASVNTQRRARLYITARARAKFIQRISRAARDRARFSREA